MRGIVVWGYAPLDYGGSSEKGKIEKILERVQRGEISIEDAVLQLKKEPFEDLEYAKIDHHRELRQGNVEAIFGEGKTPEYMFGIIKAMVKQGQKNILITRLYAEGAEKIHERYPLQYDAESRIGFVGELPEPDGKGTILIATGGASDIPVAEEAAWTALSMGNQVQRLYGVGVAGDMICAALLELVLDREATLKKLNQIGEDIQKIIRDLHVSDRVKTSVMDIYQIIAQAEFQAHNCTVEEVHFTKWAPWMPLRTSRRPAPTAFCRFPRRPWLIF